MDEQPKKYVIDWFYPTFYKINMVLPFGKHKGKVLSDVINKDPEYIEWCTVHIEWFSMSKAAHKLLDDAKRNIFKPVQDGRTESRIQTTEPTGR